MADKQYVYAVARIRSKELSLLSGAFLEQLTAAKDYDECIQLLMEKGWGEDGITNAGDILAIEKRKTWELINELVKDMSVFDVFLYANDYHNLKAAIKEVRMGDEYPGIFMDQGTVDVKLIREAVQTREFQNLPAAMRTPAEEAYKALLHTQDGQLCDIIIDKAALDAIYAAGKSSGNEFLELYAELTVAAAEASARPNVGGSGSTRDAQGAAAYLKRRTDQLASTAPREYGLFHHVGASDQNAHFGDAYDIGKRGYRGTPGSFRRAVSDRAVCGNGA